MRSWCLALSPVLALAGCATPQTARPEFSPGDVKSEALAQQRFVIEERRSETRRVASLHHKISAANLEFCKVKTKSIGADIYSLRQYGKAFREAAQSIGLTDAPTVAFVLDGSPAAKAGLQPDDKILKIDGKAFPQTNSGARKIEKAIAEWKQNRPIPIEATRAKQTLNFQVLAEDLCGYPITVAADDELNAYADGKSIILTRRMVGLAQNDEQLGFVIAHELAHNALGHIDAKQTNQALGMAGGLMLDILIAATTGYAGGDFTRMGGDLGALAYSKEFESEADYAAVYFVARAGLNTEGVEAIWRRMSVEYPKGITFGGTHPTNAERYVAIAAAREEVRAAQTAGLALKPRLKGEADAPKLADQAKATDPAAAAAPSEATTAVAVAPDRTSAPPEAAAALPNANVAVSAP